MANSTPSRRYLPRHWKVTLPALLLAGFALAMFITESAQPPKNGTRIGPLAQGTHFSVSDINDAGTIVGTGQHNNSTSRAFIWSKEQGLLTLDTLGGTSDDEGYAAAINESGVVAGRSTAGDTVHAVTWNKDGGITDLGATGGYSFSNEINDTGMIVGNVGTTAGAPLFIWTKEKGACTFFAPGGESPHPHAYAINEEGMIIGGLTGIPPHAFISPDVINLEDMITGIDGVRYEHRAFVWTEEQGIVDIGTLGGNGNTSAVALNRAGQVVGWSTTKTGEQHAFLWSAENGMSDLGTLGGPHSHAVAIDDAGAVTGTALTQEGRTILFRWDKTQGMTTLDQLEQLPGKTFHVVCASAAGQMAGYAINENDKRQACVWTPGKGLTRLHNLGGDEISVRAMNNTGMIIGNVTTHAPWWTRTWNWLGETLQFPEKYRPRMNEYECTQGAVWTVPLEE